MSENPYRPKLVFTGEPFAGRICEFAQDKITVGRGGHNTLVLHHKSVSHAHGEILVSGPEVIVRDLQSRNGTFVRGVRLDMQAQLKHGQTVWFGDVTARLELGQPDCGQDTSDETAIRAHVHIVRDQRREQAAPKQAGAAMTLGASSPPDGNSSEQTVVLNGAVLPAVSMVPPLQPVPEKPGTIAHGKLLAMLIAVAAAGVILVLRLMLRK